MASEKSKFAVHYDLGKRTLYMLGSNQAGPRGRFRRLHLLRAREPASSGRRRRPHTNPLYYYGSLAFVAGFSERFTQMLAKSVEGLVPAQGTDEPEAAPREEERDRCSSSAESGTAVAAGGHDQAGGG